MGCFISLPSLPEGSRTEEDVEAFHVLDTAKRYGEIAEEKFQGWDIPGRYLVFGDPKADLARTLWRGSCAEAGRLVLCGV